MTTTPEEGLDVDQAIEFDLVATWTAQAIETADITDPIPAACNGSGNPAALLWLARHLAIGPRDRLLDTGAGLGGPAAWMTRTVGAHCIMAEPMSGAAHSANRLFGLPGVVASAYQLPFASASFDVALVMAALSTVEDKRGYLKEVGRVLGPGGRLGLLDYVRTGLLLPDPPANNEFQTAEDLDATVSRSGFSLIEATMATNLPGPPHIWSQSADQVAEQVSLAHPRDPNLRATEDQQARFARLIDDRHLAVRLVHARRDTDEETPTRIG